MIDGKWRSMDRVPMKKGREIKIDQTDIIIVNDSNESEVAMGSSCLVYQGHIKEGTGMVEGNKVIIKEFYPFSEDAFFYIHRQEDGRLYVAESTQAMKSYQKYLKQFEHGVEYQKQLASSEAMEVAIKPLINGNWGDSQYIISDLHRGKDLHRDPPKSLKEKITVAVSLAETIGIIHDSGYLMLDIKPDNFLWIRRPNMVRIVDTDSLLKYSDDMSENDVLYLNHKYMSPEMHVLEGMIAEGEAGEFQNKIKRYLSPISDLYAIGLFLYDLFWNHMPEFRDVDQMDHEKELEEFLNIYGEKSGVRECGERLLAILSCLIIEKKGRRKKRGYKKAEDLMQALNEMQLLHKYVPRKEISHANAVFAAYNMLEKHPLYHYAKREKNGILPLNVVIVGSHFMREEILSSLLSIGQMLDSKLHIKMIAEDIEEFWEKYTSEEKNQSLKEAISWSLDGQLMGEKINPLIVNEPLAHIQLISRMDSFVLDEKDQYYIYLMEESYDNQKLLKKYLGRHLSYSKISKKQVFVGYVENQMTMHAEACKYVDFYPISTKAFSENYNEGIFEEKIYRMGLMVHAYYNGFMNEDAGTCDMKSLSNDFRSNLYNVASSERCALHSVYKMKSLGIDRESLGKFKSYYNRIQEPETLEKLAWLEHRSWTAYMLCKGARPVTDMSELEAYAYQSGNDWKDRRDPLHIGHPMLVSSQAQLSNLPEDWKEHPEKVDLQSLDCLDRFSFDLLIWYRNHVDQITPAWEEKMEEMKSYQDMAFQTALCKVEACGKDLMKAVKDPFAEKAYMIRIRKHWHRVMKQLEKYVAHLEDPLYQYELELHCSQIKSMMKAVLDYYGCRDLKQIDRDLVMAVMDIVSV